MQDQPIEFRLQDRLDEIDASGLERVIVIHAETDFHADDADQWVRVERYVLGEILEIEGRAHIRLPDGTRLVVEAGGEGFHHDTGKPAMARITAEYNVVTRQYRNARLLSFEEHQQTLDEQQLQLLIQRGANAWKDVPKASEWVDSMRGNTC